MKINPRTLILVPILSIAGAVACGGTTDPQTDNEAAALLAVKTYLNDELANLQSAVTGLQTVAPAPDADGWNATSDTAAVDEMRTRWKDARNAYERIEGAIAVLFPNLDVSTDERYDGFLESGPDDNLFDGEGVIGVHAVERILWAGQHPIEVVQFESALSGYVAASFPTTQQEADDFKNKLLTRLVNDTTTMKDDFEPLALDPATAYRGVIGSMEEQVEKVGLASTGEAESRYAGHTLADMRANLAGGVAIYQAFKPWLTSQEGGPALDTAIAAAFARIEGEYQRLSGDTLPSVPAEWNPDMPSAEDLATDYGKLWSLLRTEADPAGQDTLVALMNRGGDLLSIPELPE